MAAVYKDRSYGRVVIGRLHNRHDVDFFAEMAEVFSGRMIHAGYTPLPDPNGNDQVRIRMANFKHDVRERRFIEMVKNWVRTDSDSNRYPRFHAIIKSGEYRDCCDKVNSERFRSVLEFMLHIDLGVHSSTQTPDAIRACLYEAKRVQVPSLYPAMPILPP